MQQDTLVVCLSDMHSGSSVALFPDKLYKFNLERNHTPTEAQQRIYKHFLRCAVEAKRLRKGKRMIVVHNGDAIEGFHHQTTQVLTAVMQEQRDLHIYLMRRFLTHAGFDPALGDKVIYIKGTEIHTKEGEEKIAFEMGAEYRMAPDFVNMEINGRLIWFFHEGAGDSEGQNAGDALRLWLKRRYWDLVNRRRIIPDMIVSGHYHKPIYSTYVQRRDTGFHTMHGMILPSWQMKTRHTWRKFPATVNEIGAAFFEVSAAGDLRTPSFMLMESENGVYLNL